VGINKNDDVIFAKRMASAKIGTKDAMFAKELRPQK
jgi:hypothetical protein